MDKTQFYIAYDGRALENNEMDIRELAPALLAIADVIEEGNNVLNKGKTKVTINVKGSFKTGCFGIDLTVTQDLFSNILNFFKDENIVAGSVLLSYLGVSIGGGLIYLLKRLKGRKIKNVEIINGKAKIEVDDENIECEQEVFELMRNYKIRRGLEDAIAKPLEKDGIDSFICAEKIDKTDNITVVSKEESKYFIAPELEDELLDEKTYETNVQAVNISFIEKNKWRFTDGDITFHAEVNDEDFIRDVQNNEISFAKDDILTVRIRVKQSLTDKGIKTERTIEKIMKHRSAARQLKLPFIIQQ